MFAAPTVVGEQAIIFLSMDFLFFPVVYLLLFAVTVYRSYKREPIRKDIIKTPPPVKEEERTYIQSDNNISNSFTWSGELGGQLLEERTV